MDPAAFMGLLIPILAVSGGVTAIVYRIWTQHKERMAMIEAGMDPDLPPELRYRHLRDPDLDDDELDDPDRDLLDR